MKTFYSKQRLYLYAKALKSWVEVFEFDLTGEMLFSYKLPFNSESYNSASLLQSEEGDSINVFFCGKFGKFSTQRLQNGHVGSYQEFKLPEKFRGTKVDLSSSPIMKFGRFLVPLTYKPDHSSMRFLLFDLNSKNISNEIDLNPKDKFQTFTLNWNMKELVYTGLHGCNLEEGGQDDSDEDDSDEEEVGPHEMLFKMHKITFPDDDISLKHFARLAVLTSFSEEEISKQNLPKYLFQYLGIEK